MAKLTKAMRKEQAKAERFLLKTRTKKELARLTPYERYLIYSMEKPLQKRKVTKK